MRETSPDVAQQASEGETGYATSSAEYLVDRVQEALNLLNRLDIGDHEEVLAALRTEGDQAVELISATYQELPDDRYDERWCLVRVLGELGRGAAASSLDRVITTPIPPETSPDVHGFSSTAEEVVIRTAAVDGLGRLAAGGDQQALQSLLEHARNPVFSIRRAAAQVYLTYGGPDAKEALLQALPDDDRDLVDIRLVAPGSVPPPGDPETLRDVPKPKRVADDAPPAKPAGP